LIWGESRAPCEGGGRWQEPERSALPQQPPFRGLVPQWLGFAGRHVASTVNLFQELICPKKGGLIWAPQDLPVVREGELRTQNVWTSGRVRRESHQGSPEEWQ